MTDEAAATHYERSATVKRYVDDRAAGFTDREACAVERYFTGGDRILDVGCGAGRTTRVLDERGFDVLGVDVSRSMVRAAADADPDVEYAAGDATDLPIADEAVDHVLFSYNGIDEPRTESERVRALREVHRVLAPGGRFAFSTHNALRWLVPYPPTPDHLGSMLRFWVGNGRRGQLGTPYKHPAGDPDRRAVYYTNPLSTTRRLRAVGFDVLALLGRSGPASRYFGTSLFVVAEKPPQDRASGR